MGLRWPRRWGRTASSSHSFGRRGDGERTGKKIVSGYCHIGVCVCVCVCHS